MPKRRARQTSPNGVEHLDENCHNKNISLIGSGGVLRHGASESLVPCHCNLPPVFTQDMNNLALSEQTPVGAVVYKLEGYDPEGGNVSFGLIGSDNFIADPISGDVQVIKELDRELHEKIRSWRRSEEATVCGDGWGNGSKHRTYATTGPDDVSFNTERL
uniref:Cadherin domain-containing protein n=1 Tax=Anopheles melas TaxID=34690 RepID=A0A182THX5_9DIPT